MTRYEIRRSFNPPICFTLRWNEGIGDMFHLACRDICQQQVLTAESLVTLAYEVAAIINSGPLTALSDDPNDLTPLTLTMLLTLKSPASPLTVTDSKNLCIRKCWKQVLYLADLFSSRSTKGYLPTL